MRPLKIAAAVLCWLLIILAILFTVLDIQLSPEIMAGLADDVTKDDVVEIASKIKADSVYFLTGKGEKA